jgi:hypothetical protein
MLFAHLKRILRLDRLRLRGLSGAFDEFTLAGLASATQFATFYPTLRNSDRRDSVY